MALEPSSKAVFSRFLGERKMTIRHYDVDGAVHYETRQDCEPIVEFVKHRRETAGKSRDSIAWDHIGEVPMAVIGQWMRDGCLDDEKHIRRWLNANPDFRVYRGTV